MERKMNRSIVMIAIAIATLAAGMFSSRSEAAQLCIGTAQQLQTELSSRAEDGQADEFRIKQGTYVLGTMYVDQVHDSFSMSGGWNGDCSEQTGAPATTSLVAASAATSLTLVAQSQMQSIRNLRFSGFRQVTFGESEGGATTIVERSLFEGLGNGSGHAILLNVAAGRLHFRSNILRANATGTLIHINNDSTAAAPSSISNNSIIANDLVQLLGYTGSNDDSQLRVNFDNNIVHANAGVVALPFSTKLTVHARNNIMPDAPQFLLEGGNIDVDPRFANVTTLELAGDSPAIDSGFDRGDGTLGTLDYMGGQRWVRSAVDRGALELQRLMMDGFEG
jgi:hypothetical protein